MRKLIMWNLMGLDGRFEGPGHDISWMADTRARTLKRYPFSRARRWAAWCSGGAPMI